MVHRQLEALNPRHKNSFTQEPAEHVNIRIPSVAPYLTLIVIAKAQSGIHKDLAISYGPLIVPSVWDKAALVK